MNKNIEQIATPELEPKKSLAELESNLKFVKGFLDSAIKIGNTRSTVDFCISAYKRALSEYELARYGKPITSEEELQAAIAGIYLHCKLSHSSGENSK